MESMQGGEHGKGVEDVESIAAVALTAGVAADVEAVDTAEEAACGQH